MIIDENRVRLDESNEWDVLDTSPTFPLNSEIDNVTNYVSAVPLKELGLGLGVEHLSDQQAQELTDDYSLPALKVKTLADTAGLWNRSSCSGSLGRPCQ